MLTFYGELTYLKYGLVTCCNTLKWTWMKMCYSLVQHQIAILIGHMLWEFVALAWFFFLKLQTKIDWLWAVGWSCIDRWLQTKQFICPVCRKEVPRMRGGVMKRMLRMRLLFVSSQFWEGYDIYIYIYNLYNIPILHTWYIYIYNIHSYIYSDGFWFVCIEISSCWWRDM